MLFRGLPALALLAVSTSFTACQQQTQSAPAEQRPASREPSEPKSHQADSFERKIDIELGEFVAGTRPGRFERDPETEPATFTAKLGGFAIDAAPYPNEPGRAPLLGASREEASRLCGERGGRLCSELEWERACGGPKNEPFAGGDQWPQDCDANCGSGFGARGMGWYPEWTASDFGSGSAQAGRAVLRGPLSDKPSRSERRCAHRSPAGAKPPRQVAFRCCYGAPNAARVTEPSDGAVFTKHPLDGPSLKKLLEGHPKTADLASNLTLFAEPEAVNTVLSRGGNHDQGFDFTTTPLLWRPSIGAQFLIVAAKSGKNTSFVLAYHVVAKDEFELASSFIMQGEEGPVALAYSASIRPRMHFSSCWGCPGENGKVLFRKPDSVVILQP